MYFCLLTFWDALCYVHFCISSYSAEHRQFHCWGWIKGEFRVIIALSTPCPSDFCLSTFCDALRYFHFCVCLYSGQHRQSHCWVWIKGEFRVIIVISAPCPICTCLDAHFKCPVRWALFETLVFSQTTSVPSPRLVIWSFSCFNCYSCSPPKCVLLTLDFFCLFSRGTCPGVLKLHIDLCFSLPRRSKSILGWLIKKWQICFHITLYSMKVSTELLT
jgi:hypothetical protein